MKIIKIVFGVAIIFFICLLIYYAFGQFQYYGALKKEQNKWLNEVFKSKDLKGVIYQLDKSDEGNCFTNLIISLGKEKFASGICLCGENKAFSSFADVGDSVLKNSNSLKINIIKKATGVQKKFDFPFCNN